MCAQARESEEVIKRHMKENKSNNQRKCEFQGAFKAGSQGTELREDTMVLWKLKEIYKATRV